MSIYSKTVGATYAPPTILESSYVIILANPDQFAAYNLTDGTLGPYWSYQGVWNNVTQFFYPCTTTLGSSLVTDFPSSPVGIVVETMRAYTAPSSLIPTSTTPTVVSVSTGSVGLSDFALGTSTEALIQFAVELNMFSQSIRNYANAFPDKTRFEWSWPSALNSQSVYSFPNINFGALAGYPSLTPGNMPPVKAVQDFVNLSVTFDIDVTAGSDDYDCLIETWASATAESSAPAVVQNEIGFLAHTPSYLASYIWGLPSSSSYDYASGGFNARVATRTTSTPPFTLIMPVTSSGSTTAISLVGAGEQNFPVKAVIDDLVVRGLVSSVSYINGIQTGFEPGRNSGIATINKLVVTWA